MTDVNSSPIFRPRAIGSVEFKNRLLRSSIGGRTAYYDGTVNEAWETFESRFASGGIGGIISATFTVDDHRWSPLEYPAISHDKFVGPLAAKIGRLKLRYPDLRYILQVGDPGYHTQTSLFRQEADSLTASSGFDLLYGYSTFRKPLTGQQIKRVVCNFRQAAKRVVATGCDGIELTASKGYLIHQFLNPGTNRRKDEYGGSLVDRCKLLKEVVEAIRDAVGPGFLFGVRLSSRDYNRHPWLALLSRFGPGLRPSAITRGNDLSDMLDVGSWLERLGVDYLHVSSGFGFINAKENPGRFPTREVGLFLDSTKHLSGKARARALLFNLIPERVSDYLMNIGWPVPDPDGRNLRSNLSDARVFKKRLGIPIIVNGGFQHRADIEDALEGPDGCDMVSMARPLLANPSLPRMFEAGREFPRRPCTFCNRCAVRTTLFPLGCYDSERYRQGRNGSRRSDKDTTEVMERRIERLNVPPRREQHEVVPPATIF